MLWKSRDFRESALITCGNFYGAHLHNSLYFYGDDESIRPCRAKSFSRNFYVMKIGKIAREMRFAFGCIISSAVLRNPNFACRAYKTICESCKFDGIYIKYRRVHLQVPIRQIHNKTLRCNKKIDDFFNHVHYVVFRLSESLWYKNSALDKYPDCHEYEKRKVWRPNDQ